MDSRNLREESRGASFSNELFERRDRKGTRRYHLPSKTLVFLIIIQLHSGYCVAVITVSYARPVGARK